MPAAVVAIGGSAGSIEALRQLLPRLRADWGIAFAIVVHRQPVEDDARLPALLSGWAPFPIVHPKDGEAILTGQGVVCPANVHLQIDDGRYRLSAGPKENHSRPSLDVTFRSLADALGKGAGAIVLSGLLDDGAAGINYLRLRGGFSMAQDPREAVHAGMPQAAIRAGADVIATLAEMPDHLRAFSRHIEKKAERNGVVRSSDVTRFTCPDCNGVLVETQEGDYTYYRCRVGHTFSTQTLEEQKDSNIENALWSAVQVLEEQIDLNERVARRARERGNAELAERMETRAKRNRARANAVRTALPTVGEAIDSASLNDAPT